MSDEDPSTIASTMPRRSAKERQGIIRAALHQSLGEVQPRRVAHALHQSPARVSLGSLHRLLMEGLHSRRNDWSVQFSGQQCLLPQMY